MVPFVLAALVWLQFQFGALRVLERLPSPWGDLAVAAVWVASAAGAWLVVRRRVPVVRAAASTPWPAIVVVAAVAACALVVYPEVDGRRATGGGSDADDAVLLVVDQIRDGEDPYARDTYLGNPPTTGPGSVLWAAPWPNRRVYAASIAVGLAALVLVLRRWSGGWGLPSLTALLLASSLPFWEAVAQGSDHLVMAFGLAALGSGVQQTDASVGVLHTRVLAVLAAVVATWRGAYLHVPLVLGAALWKRDRRAAVAIGGGGTLLAISLHALLLSWTAGWDAYDPFQQLLVKSDEDLGPLGRLFVAGATVAAGAVVVAFLRRPRPDPAAVLLAAVGGPLAAVAIAGAVTATEPAAWSEASYLLPTLGLAAVVTARWLLESRAP